MIVITITASALKGLNLNAEQVDDLNKKVIDWSVPHILSAVDHYYFYLNDISHLPVPMQQPQSMSSAGSKSLPLNPYM